MDLIGKTLTDRYEIREEVGKGGMAHVYKAWCNILNRYVAIKVLKEEFKDDKEFVRRFNVEAQAAAKINNPHVVSIHDVGYENGLYYIVMEYVEGITLKEYIAQKGSLPWKEAVSHAAQICEGLDAAHKKHVIHRDIKPQNIVMAPDGVLKITDFGIARANNGQATMTNDGNAIGTVYYLSPEQARGGFTDERTDIYSLGVVLYEMLTGKLPFTDDSPVAVAIKHIQESPTPLRVLNPDIPESVETIVLHAMSKDPDSRYATADDFLKDLQAVLDSQGSGPVQNMENTTKIPVAKESADDKEDYDYVSYAQKIDREMEEKRLRNIENKRKERDRKKKDRKVTIIAIVAAVIALVAVGIGFSAISGGTLFGGGETVEIPNLVDMDLNKAQAQYKGSFSIVRKSEKQSDRTAGAILEQSPQAGDRVRKREDIVIYVVVSAGNDVVTLGNYVGQTAEQAQTALVSAGFQVNLTEQYNPSKPKNTVLGQEPLAGSTISKSGLVTLYINKEPAATPTASASAEPSETKRPAATATPAPSQSETSSGNTSGTTSGSTSSGGTSGGTSSGSTSGDSGTSSGTTSGGTSGGSSAASPGISD